MLLLNTNRHDNVNNKFHSSITADKLIIAEAQYTRLESKLKN